MPNSKPHIGRRASGKRVPTQSVGTRNIARLDMEARYQSRLNRYVTAMRKGKPDMIPIRPFVAEFTGVYAGYTCQELAHDYHKAFAAARKCAADFDWDAVVANMVYVWTGLTQAIGLKYYGIPGIDVPADRGFQYREPSQTAGLHAGRRVRSTDRGPDRLSAERLAAAGLHGHVQSRASRSPRRTTSRSSRAAWR